MAIGKASASGVTCRTGSSRPKRSGRPDCAGPVTTGPAYSTRQFYLGQIRQITPVPGICTSGPLVAPTNLLSAPDWPKSRTAP